MNQKWKWTLWTIAGVVVIGVLLGPRIAQPQSYHLFADQRTVFGISHFFDVVSNLGFLVVGVWGVVFVMKANSGANGTFLHPGERWPYFFFFLGVLLTAFGSAYYHWAPDNARLVWDRLPMAMGFMGLLAAVLAERMGPAVDRPCRTRRSPVIRNRAVRLVGIGARAVPADAIALHSWRGYVRGGRVLHSRETVRGT
jgi:hypothetical protein